MQKPPLGESPYSQKIVNEITIKTQIERTAYHNPEMSGSVSFDFENNSGKFIIGSGEYEFCTSWSGCGSRSIYGYKDNVNLIGYLSGISEIPSTKDFKNFDFTSRTRKVEIGEILIWMNNNGKFAATIITNVDVKSCGVTKNNLSFDYKIYD